MTVDTSKSAQKNHLKTLRKQNKEALDRAKQKYKDIIKTRKAIKKALAQESLSIPGLAQKTSIDANQILWHIATMRKYGLVQEDGQNGDYCLYSLLVDTNNEGVQS